MGFSREHLSKDEEVVAELRPHWWFIARQAAALVVAVLFGLIALVNDWPSVVKALSGILVLAALGFFGARYATWITTNFVITNERVISQSGIIARRGIEIPLDRINTVFFDQTIFERMIGAGDIGIESAGVAGRQDFDDIRKPALVQQEIYRQKEAYEERRVAGIGRHLAAHAGATQPAPPPVDIPAQIERLDQLRRSGALTEQEFQAKKDELLRRL